MGETKRKEQPFTYCVLNQGGAPRYFTPRTLPLGGEDQAHFSGIKRINLIVGPNNSGKSQLMRMLCRTFPSGLGMGNRYDRLSRARSGAQGELMLGLGRMGTAESRRAVELLAESPAVDGEAVKVFEELKGLLLGEVGIRFSNNNAQYQFEQFKHRNLQDRGDGVGHGPPKGRFRPVYVPNLRTVRRVDADPEHAFDLQYRFTAATEGIE